MSDHTATTSRPARQARSATSIIALVVATVLTVTTVVILLQNTIHMTINVMFWNLDVAQGVALLAAAIVGALITLSIGTLLRIRRALH